MTVEIKLNVNGNIEDICRDKSKFSRIKLEDFHINGFITRIINRVFLHINPYCVVQHRRIRCWNTRDVFILIFDSEKFELQEVRYEDGTIPELTDYDLNEAPLKEINLDQLDPFNIVLLKDNDKRERLLIIDFNNNAWIEE